MTTTNGSWSSGPGGMTSSAWTVANPFPQTYMAWGSSIYKNRAPFLYDPDISRLRDADVWQKLMRDDAVRPAWMQRVAKVVRQTWTIQPGDRSEQAKTKAKYLEAIIRECVTLFEGRIHLAHAAMWGYAPAWIEGSRRFDTIAGQFGEWWVPTALRPLDIRQIVLKSEVVTEPGPSGKPPLERLVVSPHLATLASGKHLPIVNPECLVMLVWGNDTLDRKGYGRGLDEPLYDLVWRKGMIHRVGMLGFEKWSQGITTIGINAEAHGSTTQTTQDLVDQHYEAAMQMRDNGVYIHDVRDEVKVLNPGSAGQDAYTQRINEINQAITRVILGSVLPTGHAEDVGSAARAGEEGRTTDDLLDAERVRIDDILTDRFVRLVDELNEPMWVQLDIAGAKCGRFSSAADENESPTTAAATFKAAQELGCELSKSDVYERLRIKQPTGADDVLKAPAPSLSGFPGFGGAGPGGGGSDLPPPNFGNREGAKGAEKDDGTPARDDGAEIPAEAAA